MDKNQYIPEEIVSDTCFCGRPAISWRRSYSQVCAPGFGETPTLVGGTVHAYCEEHDPENMLFERFWKELNNNSLTSPWINLCLEKDQVRAIWQVAQKVMWNT